MILQKIAGFDWDVGNLQKCQKHGVSIPEIEALFHGNFLSFPDSEHSESEDRIISIGKSLKNRWIFVVWTLRMKSSKNFIRPISARFMHRKEVENYEKIANTKK